MFNFILFAFNVVIKFYNAFPIHKAIGKQASITKILISGVFGIFSHTLTRLIAEAQEIDNTSDDSDNNSHSSNNNYTRKRKKKSTRGEQNRPQKPTHQTSQINITQQPFLMDNDDNHVFVDTNYKHYKTTKRRSNKGIQIKDIDSTH